MTSNYTADAAMSRTRATKSVLLEVLNVAIAINAVTSAKLARKETKYTKYNTIQALNKKITLT